MTLIRAKKSSSLMFFIELVLLIGVIGVMFFGASKVVSNEGKYLTLDAMNLALFLERIPSIDNNFVYYFKFKTPQYSNVSYLDIQITDKNVFLDFNGRKSLRYKGEYQNPKTFQFASEDTPIEFKKIKGFYVYKIGEEVFFEEKIEQKYESLLKKTTYDKTKINNNALFFEKNKNIQKSYDYSEICDDTLYSNNEQIWILKTISNTNPDKELKIYYNLLTKDIAKKYYNDIVERNDIKDVVLIPINENKNIFDILQTNGNCNEQINQNPYILLVANNENAYISSIVSLQQGGFIP